MTGFFLFAAAHAAQKAPDRVAVIKNKFAAAQAAQKFPLIR